ncbi:MAG: aminotransferase class V-fold PLP-dependent enzyme, partial [Candidatus Nanohaloarchaea archaeon]
MKRQQFPPLKNSNIVYLDNACMSLRPEQVIQKIEEYYREYPACSGRSAHKLSRKASEELETARKNVAGFIDAEKDDILFTSGTTESINTVAKGFDREKVIISDREHNSNLVPWQKQEDNIEVIDTENSFNLEKLKKTVEEGDLVSVVHVSNLDGYELPVKKICRIARENNAYTMIDAAQSIPHQPFSVKEVPADFVAFSGHKMCGPSGTGALYVSDRVKQELEPLKTGGGAVTNSSYSSNKPKEFPHSFEAGLPNLAGFIGFGEAINFLESIGMEKIQEHEKKLTEKARERIEQMEGVQTVGKNGEGVISFHLDNVEPSEAGVMLDRKNIAVRSGMHCVHSWFNDRDIKPTVRASLYLYNNEKDVERFLDELKKLA